MLAAGEPGGFYVEFGELLAAALRAAGLPVTVVGTGGSVQNIEQLRDGAAALGLALTDIALAARNGQEPFDAPMPLQAIGRVYENYMQLVVRAEDPRDQHRRPGRPPGLARRRRLGRRGVRRPAARGGRHRRGGDPPPPARRRGRARVGVDRRAPVVGRGAHARRSPNSRRGVRSGCCRLPSTCRSCGPATGPSTDRSPCRQARTAPQGRLPTVGVANLLVCSPDLPADTAAAVARTLVAAAPALVPESALGTQYLDQRSLIGTGDVPLHPGAAAAYRDLHG